jgi:hypothetical protein
MSIAGVVRALGRLPGPIIIEIPFLVVHDEGEAKAFEST